jgi:hypothetical protein
MMNENDELEVAIVEALQSAIRVYAPYDVLGYCEWAQARIGRQDLSWASAFRAVSAAAHRANTAPHADARSAAMCAMLAAQAAANSGRLTALESAHAAIAAARA